MKPAKLDWDLARGFHVGPELRSTIEAEDTTAVRPRVDEYRAFGTRH
jgi:hypothetical protein